MRIKTLELENFRGIERLTLHLHPRLTILLGENATGKTSLLDALAIGVGSYFTGLEGKGIKAPTIDKDDIRLTKRAPEGDERITSISPERHVPTKLLLGVEWGEVEQIARTKRGFDGRTDWSEIGHIKKMASTHQKMIRDGGQITLPLVTMIPASARTRRATPTPNLSSGGAQSSRAEGYRAALEANMDSDTLLNWWIWTEVRRSNGLPGFKELLEAFHHILKCILPELIDIDFDAIDGLPEFLFSWGSCKFSWLSSGQERVVLIVADLFFRAMILNPQLADAAAREVEGVVLIDEIDQSLHPSWQRTILRGLLEAFPKVQFVVSTHAEQVLAGIAGLDEEAMVRRLSRDEEGRVRINTLKVPVGMDADAMLLGEWFGLSTTLDRDTEELMQRHAELLLERQQRSLGLPVTPPRVVTKGRGARSIEEIEALLTRRLGGWDGEPREAVDPTLRAARIARLKSDEA